MRHGRGLGADLVVAGAGNVAVGLGVGVEHVGAGLLGQRVHLVLQRRRWGRREKEAGDIRPGGWGLELGLVEPARQWWGGQSLRTTNAAACFSQWRDSAFLFSVAAIRDRQLGGRWPSRAGSASSLVDLQHSGRR